MKTTPAFERLSRLGCELQVRYAQNSTRYRWDAVRGGVPIATEYSSRTGTMNLSDALLHARRDRFGPTSTVYAALQRLAERVESVALTEDAALERDRRLFWAERELEELRRKLAVQRELASKRDLETRVANVANAAKAL